MGFSCFCVAVKIMKETLLLLEPHILKTFLTGRQFFAKFVGGFVFLVIGLLSFSAVEANDFELTLKDLVIHIRDPEGKLNFIAHLAETASSHAITPTYVLHFFVSIVFSPDPWFGNVRARH